MGYQRPPVSESNDDPVAQSWRALAHAPSETAGLEWGAFALAEIGKSAGRELADADRLPDTITILKIGMWV
jgi:hypothetical protein